MVKKLCNISDIGGNKSAGFTVKTNDGRCGLILIRLDDEIFCYLNSCPHIGTPLEIQPDRFLNQTGEYILCSTHGALFQIEDGLCIAGPCVNEKLTRVEIEVHNNSIYINPQKLPTLWPPNPPLTDIKA